MATELEELVIKIDANLDDLKKEIAKGKAAADSGARGIAGSFDKIGASVAQSRTQFNNWAKIAVAAFSAAAGAVVRSQLKTIDAVAKTSDELGIATDKLIGLQHAAELTGAGADSIAPSLRKMTRFIGEGATGAAEYTDTLNRLGLSVNELIKLSPDQQFQKISESINTLPTRTEQASAAMEIFGRSGSKLLNLMGSDMGALIAEADRLGISVNRLDAAKIEAANDAITRAKAAFTGAARTLTIQLAPIIEAVANKFTEAALAGGGFGEQIKGGISNALKAVGIFADGLRGLEIIFKVLQIAAEGFLLHVQFMFSKLQEGALAIINTYREMRGLDPLEGINVSLDENLASVERLKGELHGLLMEKLPSEGLQETLDEITLMAEASAQKIAEAKNNAMNVAAGGEANDGGASGVGGIGEAQRTPEERLEAIEIQNELELELLRKKHADEQTVLQEALDNKLISEQDFVSKSTALKLKAARESEAIAKQNQNRLLQAQKFGELQRLNSFLKTNNDTLRAAASFAGDSFEITKKLDLASAIVDTAAGVTKALSTNNFGAAAAIAIKGAAQIKAIRGTTLGGGGSVAGVGGTSAGSGGGGSQDVASAPSAPSEAEQTARRERELLETATPQNSRRITVQVPDGALLSSEQVRNLLDDIAREQPNLQVETV